VRIFCRQSLANPQRDTGSVGMETFHELATAILGTT